MTGPVKIVQFYPATLGITGDRGNARTLVQRLSRGGVDAQHLRVSAGEDIPADADILIFGNGPLSAMRGVIDDLRARADRIRGFLADGGVLLAVGGSAELLSSEIALVDGGRLPGAAVLPYRVERTRQRRVGYVLADSAMGRIVGFEDHASAWHLDDEARGLARVTEGNGSFVQGEDRGEIVRWQNAFATNVQGPALPLNPLWTKELLRLATQRRGIDWDAEAGAERLDALAEQARQTIEKLLHERGFNAISV